MKSARRLPSKEFKDNNACSWSGVNLCFVLGMACDAAEASFCPVLSGVESGDGRVFALKVNLEMVFSEAVFGIEN